MLLMSPLAYTGAKMLTLDVAKCLQAGGARFADPKPKGGSIARTCLAATALRAAASQLLLIR